MKKVLFIDRDGTLIIEPPTDFQVDSLDKLEFYPGVFQNLSRIAREMDYELVMVTNQDGLGTESFPFEEFIKPHEKMLKAFQNEGIIFSDIHIDNSFEHENKPTRKPGTAMLEKYRYGQYDLENSYVIGDRVTDIQLADNLGAKAIFLNENFNAKAELTTTKWEEIYRFLKQDSRTARVKRTTNETDIDIEINLNGTGRSDISTGLHFFNHMLDQIARHGSLDLKIKVNGDLQVDEHHTIEDTGIALGEAILKALGNKKGIERYGFLLPMDDCLAQAAIDFGGRPWLVWEADFKREKIGDVPTEMFFHFFKSLTDSSRSNLNLKAEGNNEHHKIEALFKAFAKALKMAVKQSDNTYNLPTTKGSL
ncbi:MAG: bifunctional histidinol-phosphatase/imidazoleglycerol-phosphate dehydratase HisB [Chryseobacterium sp.]|jgi:imidazoleglycerol-phosphate dehydratase/histidinol-phosphatase|uniref:bifunctional histidinol-phosphatase/imidazoleglycerol-phosphate dehydratase HisB n=1 Tax=Chryseobacterium sp. TaxID=1871047 RepID=UPI00281D4606|nr:bifunctional histidinol-phosphatase/imidazoleglycerol-phosphate dehydratase HisB [Chryseobacterium sp.]MDR2238009.1 bifunctional histidinol-phosphatase/imidazoleglycerol-phosphate dehydratase HisB [Chryseobacterium sp.]